MYDCITSESTNQCIELPKWFDRQPHHESFDEKGFLAFRIKSALGIIYSQLEPVAWIVKYYFGSV